MLRTSIVTAIFVLGTYGCAPEEEDGVPADAGSDVGTDAQGDAGADVRIDGDTGVPDAGPPEVPPTVVDGAENRILLKGTIVSPTVVIEGEVLVEGDTITCVEAGNGCESAAGAAGATIVDTQGIIAPGLIDTHNHILFDIFDNDDWMPLQSYANHNQWTEEARYAAMLDVKHCLGNDSQGKPPWCAQTPYGTAAGSLRCEMNKFGELKGLVSGTTTIVGLPGTSAACYGTLARSIDVPQNGTGTDRVQSSTLFPPSRASADAVCGNFTALKTDAYLIHCGEGTDAVSRAEFQTLGSVSTQANCLYAPQTTITHGTAFTATEFQVMAAAGMKLTWSPQSNISLYGATTDIPAALDAGVTVSLGPDWSLGGSQNLLDEMRFAKAWSDAHWNGRLSAKDIVLMATANGAEVLALDPRIGYIRPGSLADLAVYAGDRTAPYDAIVSAHAKDVRLVMVGGVVLFGDKRLEAAGPAAPGCESIATCGESKFLCAATTDPANKFNQTFASIQGNLEKALLDTDALSTDDAWNFSPLPPLVHCP